MWYWGSFWSWRKMKNCFRTGWRKRQTLMSNRQRIVTLVLKNGVTHSCENLVYRALHVNDILDIKKEKSQPCLCLSLRDFEIRLAMFTLTWIKCWQYLLQLFFLYMVIYVSKNAHIILYQPCWILWQILTCVRKFKKLNWKKNILQKKKIIAKLGLIEKIMSTTIWKIFVFSDFANGIWNTACKHVYYA